jgi:hypothetical protein
VTSLPFKFDEIGYWSELKLAIVEKYGAAYTKAFTNTGNLKNTISMPSAVPAFTSRRRPGSPLRAAPHARSRSRRRSTGFILSISTPTKPTISGQYVGTDPTFTSTTATAMNI